MYWHIHEFPTRAAAEAARGPRGTVADVFDRHWLYTIAAAEWRPAAGERIARIGPLDVAPNTPYTARYMEAFIPPRGPEPYGTGGHRHPGPEAWYVVRLCSFFTAAPNRTRWRLTIIEATALRTPIGSRRASAPGGNDDGRARRASWGATNRNGEDATGPRRLPHVERD